MKLFQSYPKPSLVRGATHSLIQTSRQTVPSSNPFNGGEVRANKGTKCQLSESELCLKKHQNLYNFPKVTKQKA